MKRPLDAATYWTLDSTGNWALLDGRYGSADDEPCGAEETTHEVC